MSGAVASRAFANGRFPESQRLLEHPSDPNRLYLTGTTGLLVTEDRGANWYTICEQSFALRFLEGDPLLEVMSDGSMLGGIFETLNRSSDCGCTWQTTLGASDKETVLDMTIVASTGSVLALVQDATTFPGRFAIHESVDGGKTWRKLSDLPVEIVNAFTVDVAPSDPSRVYVSGIMSSTATTPTVLAVSNDHGATWVTRTIAGTRGGAYPYIAAVHPTDPNRLFVRTDEWDDTADIAANDALYYSDDGGQSWREVFRRSAKLFGFALSPDGGTVLIGYGDPLQAGGRSTNSDDFGIYKASTTDMVFEKIFVASISCLRWTSHGVYACIVEDDPGVPTPGMSLGFAANPNFTLATAKPLTSLLSVRNVRGPLGCVASVCLANWKSGTDTVAATCELLRASCDRDPSTNVLSCAAGPGTGGSRAAGSGGAGGRNVDAGSTGGSAASGKGGGCGCSASGHASDDYARGLQLILILIGVTNARRRSRRRGPREAPLEHEVPS